MRVLWLLWRDLGDTGSAILREHEHERGVAVEVIDLRSERDYARVVEAVDGADRVVCW